MSTRAADVAIIGSGIVGIATAYYLMRNQGIANIALVDQGQPMAFTSAQSGENYRNWWPHPQMANFTNRSIDLMEEIARETDNRIAMTRRGYILATRKSDIQPLIENLTVSLGSTADAAVRHHRDAEARTYQRPRSPDWRTAPAGYDLLQNQDLIRVTFPSLDKEVQSILHIRRAGDISVQQLGQVMLERLKDMGVRRVTGMVTGIARKETLCLTLTSSRGTSTLAVSQIVNAAGPFAGHIANMLGVELPLYNVVQQKVSFQDTAQAIPRDMPFAIDLDGQCIDWTEDERAALAMDATTARFTEEMHGAIHCRPDGGERGSWIKLGWAYNTAAARPSWQIPLDAHFPEIVLRGAARLNPGLRAYYGRLPRGMHHYGGWYTRTRDNWPLIGPMGVDGTFMACALSGHGTMTACAAGELAARWVTNADLPSYGKALSLDRFRDTSLAPAQGLPDGVL